VKAAREFNPHQRIPEFPNSREVGPVQRTIYPAEYSRIDRITVTGWPGCCRMASRISSVSLGIMPSL